MKASIWARCDNKSHLQMHIRANIHVKFESSRCCIHKKIIDKACPPLHREPHKVQKAPEHPFHASYPLVS